MNIGHIKVGHSQKPFIIAEMSGNHNQSLENALQIVRAAADAGAHCLKLQTYTADTITLDVSQNEFFIADKSNLWEGQSLYDLYKKAYTPWEWHKPIFDYAKSLGMLCFSSPFDESAVDFLETLDVPAYKIASFENNHLPLIKKAASTGKPLIISTGMASLSELQDAVDTARANGCKDLVLLKCTSTYPADPENSNLYTIPHMRQLFDCEVGLSDHTLGIGVPVAAVALGASVIEKHLTMNRNDGGVDSSFSLEPSEFKEMINETEKAWKSLGRITYGPTEAEKKSLKYRRSLYISEDVNEGDIITASNIKCVRPGLGLEPKFYEKILGKKARVSMKKGTPLSFDLLN